MIAVFIFYKVIPQNLLLSSPTEDPYDPFGFSSRNNSQWKRKVQVSSKNVDIHSDQGGAQGKSHDKMMEAGVRDGVGIAIGMAITSKGIDNITVANLVRYKFPFFR